MAPSIQGKLAFSLFLLFPMTMVLGFAEIHSSPVTIHMESWAPYYRPFEATIPSQTTIQWENPTASPHTVRHDGCMNEGPCLFDSGSVAPNGSFTISGLAPGRYFYHCELHPIMRGELIIHDQGIDFSLELASMIQRTKD